MFDKTNSFKMPESISIASLTIHNHFNIKIGAEIMSKVTELLAKIETIASAGSVEAVQAEVDEIKTALTANETADAETKLAVEEHGQVIEALVNKLAAAPAPTDESTGGENA